MSAPSAIQRRPRTSLPGRRERMRHMLHGASLVLIVAGLFVLLDAVLTLVWQEPISALYAHVRQDELGSELAAMEREPPSPLVLGALDRLHAQNARIALLAADWQRRVREDGAVGRIEIPRIGADFIVVRGTSAHDLESGPGVYPQTGFPGAPGTTAIAGHRTTYLAPFRNLGELHPGDHIVVEMPYGRFTYAVQSSARVSPYDVAIVRSVGYQRLVLSSCDPLFSAAHRLVVFARLSSVVALGAAVHL
ncbi:MAG TPA: class E sortase [Solirubrobacteraceae bacterium]|jgi:sortase A|nr:class E sortase [Solirubrobacteraceae bacterium]